MSQADPRHLARGAATPAGLLLAAALATAAGPAPDPLTTQRIAATAALQAIEAQAADAAANMASLTQRRVAAERRLAAQSAALQPMLPLLARLSRYPAETILAVPAAPGASPGATLRGLLVLEGLTRRLEQDAEAIRAEEAVIDRLTMQAMAEDRRLTEAQASQGRLAVQLDRQLAEAAANERADTDAVRRAAQLAAQQAAQQASDRAASIRAAVEQLDAARRTAEARARQATARVAPPPPPAMAPGTGIPPGGLATPVAGSVLYRFGDDVEDGRGQGMVFQPAPAAHVSAPCGGRVVFAGPFRSFGLLMIVDCGQGIHVVLAGMDRLDAAPGRAVQPGEPIGAMAAWDPRGAGGHPTLYVELRQNGVAINPSPFLHARS